MAGQPEISIKKRFDALMHTDRAILDTERIPQLEGCSLLVQLQRSACANLLRLVHVKISRLQWQDGLPRREVLVINPCG